MFDQILGHCSPVRLTDTINHLTICFSNWTLQNSILDVHGLAGGAAVQWLNIFLTCHSLIPLLSWGVVFYIHLLKTLKIPEGKETAPCVQGLPRKAGQPCVVFTLQPHLRRHISRKCSWACSPTTLKSWTLVLIYKSHRNVCLSAKNIWNQLIQ